MLVAIEFSIKLVAYVMMFVGISWLVIPLLKDSMKLRKRTYRIKRNSQSTSVKSKRTSVVHEHIKLLVNSTSKKLDDNAVIHFYVLTFILFTATLVLLLLLTKSIVVSVFLALIIGVLPYIGKRFSLAAKRLELAIAFMKEFHIFLQAYQHNRDVYHTLVETVQSVQDKGLHFELMKILSTMQKERNLEAFHEAMLLFNYSVNTSFATRFSNLLIKEYRESVDISESLLDLQRDLQKRQKDMATLKTKRMETIILGYMPLFILPIFVFVARQMTVMYTTSPIFANTQNVVLFMIALIISIISAMSAYLFNKPNADI